MFYSLNFHHVAADKVLPKRNVRGGEGEQVITIAVPKEITDLKITLIFSSLLVYGSIL
jgi:hypothetical protein